MQTIKELFDYIESFTNLEKAGSLYTERTYRLDRMQVLLERFGRPQDAYKTIHIAGTKGKGSTALFVASAISAAGLRTGLYTSPHVSDYTERIALLPEGTGKPSEPQTEILLRIGARIKKTVDTLELEQFPAQGAPTTFELLTLLGFCYFRETRCEYGVIETGIGGRLDATNMVTPELCLITPIELEHTDVLGNTLESIALEKGGIIKPGVPVYGGIQNPTVKTVLRRIAEEKGTEITFLDEEVETLDTLSSTHGSSLTLHLKNSKEARHFELSMTGSFQGENAALAYLALSRRYHFPENCYHIGFEKAFLPARMELLSADPAVILDGAHTPRSTAQVLSNFRRLYPHGGGLIFGAASGKRIVPMAEILGPAFDRPIITTPGDFRESDPQAVYRAFKAVNPQTRLVKDPGQALKRGLSELEPGRALLITGSFYLAAEIKKHTFAGGHQAGSVDNPAAPGL